tara:strand:+ start:96 stop:356 length:261 start_codon:yes stop_codon:yes gene_type:complete
LCEDLPEAIALLRVNSIVDEDESLLICQSEDGVIGSVSKSTQGGAAYVTREGIEDTFCVLILGEPVDDDYGVEEELGDIVDALRKK